MLRKIITLLFITICIASRAVTAWAQDISKLEAFNKKDRILILAPHPDDETIACAGVIQQAKKAGAEIKIVYLTNGDHNQFSFIVYEKRITFRQGEFIHMGQVRQQEAVRAMKLLGLSEDKLVFLGYPDFGTFAIFSQYWQTKTPFSSILTRISKVPYKNDFSFGAPYTGESILNDLEKIILNYKPSKIFVSHPADVNLDHKALYLFLQISLFDLRGRIPAPKIYPYLVHSSGWPKPRDYHPELNLNPPQSFADSQIQWLRLDLTPEELEQKHQATLCYKSQTMVSAFYLLSFARTNELFGDYPGIEINKQDSPGEGIPKFFGFSKILMSAKEGEEEALDEDSLIQGRGEVSYALAGKFLLIRVAKDKELIHKFNLIIYIFGYGDKMYFAAMPKIRIVTDHKKFRVYDGKKEINPRGISLNVGSEDLILRLPLSILGNPDFILTSTRTYEEKLPFSATGFRKIDIK